MLVELGSMPVLDGSVESIVFRNEENHYTVARFRLNDRGRLFRDDLTTIVGALPGIHVGELLTVEGEWENDPRYGRQLHVATFTQRLPASTDGIIRYLSSGLIKGIGPKKAKLIVDHFGDKTNRQYDHYKFHGLPPSVSFCFVLFLFPCFHVAVLKCNKKPGLNVTGFMVSTQVYPCR